eukprot:768221-Hanusia_phi.AAC.3
MNREVDERLRLLSTTPEAKFELRDSTIELTTEESRRCKEYEIEAIQSEFHQLQTAEEGRSLNLTTTALKMVGSQQSCMATAQ